jgi:hypothetical protein
MNPMALFIYSSLVSYENPHIDKDLYNLNLILTLIFYPIYR